MKVGDLIQCVENWECGSPVSIGLICKIEHVAIDRVAIEARYWTVWFDGQYAWVTEEDEPDVISAGNH